MATPPLNLSGMGRLSGEAVSQPKVSNAVRRLLVASRQAQQVSDLLVDELSSGTLPAGAAQHIGRQIQVNRSVGAFNLNMAKAKFAEEQATEGRAEKIAMAAVPALGTLAAQYIGSRPGDEGDAATGGMEQAWQETVSPGDLTVPGGAAARLQAQATKRAQQSQLGVPALDVSPEFLVRAAPDISAINQFGERGSARTIDPSAPADARLPSISGQYQQQELPSIYNVEDQSPQFSPRSGKRGYAPSFAPETLGKTSFDARVDAARAYPQADQFPDISGRSKDDKALMGVEEKPDIAQLISAAMDHEDDKKKREELQKIIQQYGLALGGE